MGRGGARTNRLVQAERVSSPTNRRDQLGEVVGVELLTGRKRTGTPGHNVSSTRPNEPSQEGTDMSGENAAINGPHGAAYLLRNSEQYPSGPSF